LQWEIFQSGVLLGALLGPEYMTISLFSLRATLTQLLLRIFGSLIKKLGMFP
jgi:hypothetical protein